MNAFLRLGAYLFHPLFMPLLGTTLYYILTPKFIEPTILISHLVAVGVLTFLIPVIFFFLLRNLGVVSSIHLRQVQERKIPLMLQSILILLLIKYIFHPVVNSELYYFFIGVLGTTLSALVLVFFKFKVSLHQMAVAGVLFYCMLLSIHFHINSLKWIGFFVLVNGWVASSRLHTKSHTVAELTTGFFIGAIPQLLFVPAWL